MKVAGLGFRARATVASLENALQQAEAQGGAVEALATPISKSGAACLNDLARARNVKVRFVEVAGITTPTQSPKVLDAFGTGSVAEAAALACAGPDAHMLVPRVTSDDGCATAAIAESPS